MIPQMEITRELFQCVDSDQALTSSIVGINTYSLFFCGYKNHIIHSTASHFVTIKVLLRAIG